jgi:hypothetical protein
VEIKMLLRGLEFLAIVLVAIILMPAGAHFFELPNKIPLVQDQYFIVQTIYRGWALFGWVIFPALAVTGLLAWAARESAVESRLALLACLLPAFASPLRSASSSASSIPRMLRPRTGRRSRRTG